MKKQRLKVLLAFVLLALITLAALFAAPFVINYLYVKLNIGSRIPQSQESLLTYWGVIVAAFSAFLGVSYSVQYSRKQYRKDQFNRVKPHIALNTISKNTCDEADGKRVELLQKGDNVNNGIHIVLSENSVSYVYSLSAEQKAVIQNNGFRWTKVENKLDYVRTDFLNYVFGVKNVGCGAAIDLKLSFSKDGKAKDCKDASLFTLATGDVFLIHLFSEKYYDSILGKYTLTFLYHDIMDTRYPQYFPFEFYQEGEKYKIRLLVRGIPVTEYDQDSPPYNSTFSPK